MEGIEINGNKLYDIRLHQRSFDPGITVTMRYPEHRIQYCFKIGVSYIEVPSLLAVELYRIGIIPQNPEKTFFIKENGRQVGIFFVKKVVYPDSLSNDVVRFELERINL